MSSERRERSWPKSDGAKPIADALGDALQHLGAQVKARPQFSTQPDGPRQRGELSDDNKSARSKFTRRKLQWIEALCYDRRVTHQEFRFGVYVAMRINWKTEIWIISDATAVDETGIPRTNIYNARKKLVELGWILIGRPNKGAPYTYGLCNKNVDELLKLRAERRHQRRKKWSGDLQGCG